MMAPSATDTIEAPRKRASRTARLEGYLALLFVVALFLPSGFPPLPEALGVAVGVSIWACGWLFAISGMRHGVGGARVAAIIGLTILVLHAALIVIIALH
jgi:hypothetical protein